VVKAFITRYKGAINMWDSVKYFKAKEFACQCCGKENINSELVEKVDKLRGLYGLPIKVTSGYRCPDHPLTVSRPTSSHAKGLAVDIAARTSRERYMLLELIFKHQLFKRIGISGIDKFIHVDVDQDKSDQVVWLY
jgi:zinc D-Ala-D-Ala carboxypeptidase